MCLERVVFRKGCVYKGLCLERVVFIKVCVKKGLCLERVVFKKGLSGQILPLYFIC